MNNLDFDFSKDEFLRNPIARGIIKLITSTSKFSPLIIDGDWGTGKTIFCKRIIDIMNNEFEEEYKNRILYIDAFQTESYGDALSTILSEIITLYPKKKSDIIKSAVPVILKAGLITAGKAAGRYLLRQDFDTMASDYEDIIEKSEDQLLEKAVSRLLNKNQECKQGIDLLKKTLIDLTKNKSIFIFIDELDRCRPDFALDFLEKIKHIFNVGNVNFILISNLKHLSYSVGNCYGQLFDGYSYLEKFYKYKVSLPKEFSEDSSRRKVLASIKYFNILVAESEQLNGSCLVQDSFEKTIANRIIFVSNLSLRKVEAFIRNLEVFDILAPANIKITSQAPSLSKALSIMAIYVLSTYKTDEATQLLTSNTYEITNIFGSQGEVIINGQKDNRFDIIKSLVNSQWDKSLRQRINNGWSGYLDFTEDYKNSREFFNKIIQLMQFL